MNRDADLRKFLGREITVQRGLTSLTYRGTLRLSSGSYVVDSGSWTYEIEKGDMLVNGSEKLAIKDSARK